MRVLGIETSCDETGVAVYDTAVGGAAGLRAHAVYSQIALHAEYGGVVPELASRDHVRKLLPLVRQTLAEAGLGVADLDGVAYTAGPGLVGALLVGAGTARALAWALDVPAIGVHHMEGHLLAPLMEDDPPQPPFVALLVSGGHTQLVAVEAIGSYRLLGETLDDAAGEAFDKAARMLGLGYPGGPALERLAREGDPAAFKLPVAMSRGGGLDFSFSGLKTALAYLCRDLGEEEVAARAPDLAASFQAAVVGQLCAKLERALKQGRWPAVALGGGVAANGPLRDRVGEICERHGLAYKRVAMELCTDNAAMIGSAARYANALHYPEYLAYDAFATRFAAA